MANQPDPHGMTALLEPFLEWMRVRNYSEETIVDRRTYLRFFIRWCEQRGLTRPREVTKPAIERYQRFLYHYRKKDGRPLTVGSQHGRLVPVRAWFKWLTRNNHILYNPAAEIELPRLEHRLPKHVLSQREADLVINATNVHDPLGVRDRAILETLYSTGIRRRELIRLSVWDMDAERGTVLIRQGKGRKDRMVPIGDRAIAWIEKYCTEVRPALVVGDAAGDTLFLSHLGRPFHANALTILVGEYVQAADVGKRGSCHLFRHTMATLMLENGADIRHIQAMLGHARLTTTEIYTQVSIRKLKEVHTKTHPAKLHRPK